MNQLTQVMSTFKIRSSFFLCSICCLMMASNANAQIGKRIKERIKQNTERKIEDKIVNKVDKKSDQVLDSLFKERSQSGSSESSGKNETEESTSSSDSGFDIAGMMNASYESSYTLDQEFKVEIRTKEKKKEEVVNMDMFYGKGCYMMVVQDEEGNTVPMKTLMDLKNNSSLMLNDEEMTGMAISMDFVTDKIGEAIENDQDSTGANYTFRKTGKTKMIAGYSCEEYFIETDESTMNVWYTQDISIDIHDNMNEYAMFGSFSGAMANAPKGQAAGMMMESHMVEKTGKKGTFDYVVKEVILVPSTINMSDYTMGMGGM